MADYGPLTPSNRLEWFLANGGSGGSGGGGGDENYTTATLKIIDATTDGVAYCYVPNLTEYGMALYADGKQGTGEHSVPIYKNLPTEFVPVNCSVISYTGEFVDDDGDYYVAGNCTVTVSADTD